MRAFLLVGALLVGMATARTVENNAGLRAVSEGANTFSTSFFKAVAASNPGNMICSPLSVDIVLAMLSLGARGNTLRELQTGLNLPADENLFRSGYGSLLDQLNNVQNVELQLANKIFDAESNQLRPQYESAVRDIFKSEIQKVNFANSPQAAKTINDWAAANTNNKIRDLFQPDAFNSMTALVLANAIYFKGQWDKQFLPANTRPAPFHIDETTTKNVDTMYKRDRFNNGYLQELNARWIELPYRGNEISMVIIMPNEINGLANLQANIEKVNMTEMLNSGNRFELELWMPKFKIETELKLKPTLQQLGMGEMFSDNADLSGISQDALKVSEAIQKAYIEVNEEGTEAAAVTGIVPVLMSMLTHEFKIDRPFVYTIIHKQTKPREKRADDFSLSFGKRDSVEEASPLFLGSVHFPQY